MAKNFTGRSIDNILLSEIDAPIGSYRDTDLSPAQFAEESVGVWMLCNGQSCAGTAYAAKTGKATVPDFVTTGAFKRQVKNGVSSGNLEQDAIQGHRHAEFGPSVEGKVSGVNYPVVAGVNNNGTGSSYSSSVGLGWIMTGYNGSGAGGYQVYTGTPSADGANGSPRTASETRPVNIGVNVYIKVGY